MRNTVFLYDTLYSCFKQHAYTSVHGWRAEYYARQTLVYNYRYSVSVTNYLKFVEKRSPESMYNN